MAQAQAAAKHANNHIDTKKGVWCLVCGEELATERTPICRKCAGWCRYWIKRNKFQFRAYQKKLVKARTRSEVFEDEQPTKGEVERVKVTGRK